MKRVNRAVFFLALGLWSIQLSAQKQLDSSLVQFSGMIVAEEDNELVPVPYVNIFIKDSNRGTYSNLDGFFSIVGHKGDRVTFSAIGYAPVDFVIPDTLKQNRYTIYQILTRDTLNLPEAVVYPWPSREYFKVEFLALDVDDQLHKKALANLSDATMAYLVKYIPSDGKENASIYLRQQATDFVYRGQIKPQNIFNPIAWGQFIKAWKEGKFKRKKK